ncbi:DNA-binding transcriptional LysR family regulator [Alkalispirillum mobile]|uniref:DNA-binding transcriptional LysR family regulator n=1 Tax=Alkalispirillum mobile TaxID=85925 RepID=A0A498C715_9GAMM|nr:LysR family transcriptional regulator [Alkalispirillum mobile]RLK50859.1 DNA-binding transcriptional LysR family regulator [Alkalispirillum mobile]
MKDSQIEIFLAVVEHGSVAGAARTLGRSRTTVSTALSALEDELGVPLFERSGNQLHLTPVGGSIVTDCQRLQQVVGQIQARCRHHMSGAESALRIARDDALPEAAWRDLLRRMKRAFPHTSVSVYLAPPRELPDLVERQAVDVAYGLMPQILSVGYQWFRELADVRMLTVAASDHPLATLPRVTQDDLVGHTEIVLAYLDKDGLIPESPETDNYLAFTQYELIRDAVIEGAGWADLPLPLISHALRHEQLRTIPHPGAKWWKTFCVLESEQAHGGPVVTWLANELEAYLSRIS